MSVLGSSDVLFDPAPLSWARSDLEQRLGFRGGRFTRVNTWLTALLAAVASVAFYAALLPIRETYFGQMFLERGPIPYVITFFTAWAGVILCVKWTKLRLQQRALAIDVVPGTPDFVLSPQTVDEVQTRILHAVEDPRQFVLFNRIAIALSNLRNLGRVADVDEILQTQAGNDESVMETSYSIVQGFVWAIPVLGFIGTVQGLSIAIGSFGSVLSQSSEMTEVKDALRGVTGGLSIAFETTLQGLVAALVVQLLLTVLKKNEEEFLDSCTEYCTRRIVGRLRLSPLDREGA
ncbi:MAG: MotA/TolQ/ExbB proton channel family protein [Planctomycetaceae bacterium]